MRRIRYRFVGRLLIDGVEVYEWMSVTPLPNDSRHERIRCSVSWFWGDRNADVPAVP